MLELIEWLKDNPSGRFSMEYPADPKVLIMKLECKKFSTASCGEVSFMYRRVFQPSVDFADARVVIDCELEMLVSEMVEKQEQEQK